MKKLIIVCFAALIVAASSAPGAAQESQSYFEKIVAGQAPMETNEFIEAVFAPPSADELESVFEALKYEPYCKDFTIGDVYSEEPGYAFHYVTYDSDGYRQTGLFGLPEGDGPFRLLVMNHSGVTGIPASEVMRLREFVEHDYAIAMATYRDEKGDAGEAEGEIDVFGDEMHDIMNLMRCALENDRVDPEKVVMFGISHGGGLTVKTLEQTEGVAAAAILSAPTNLMGNPIKTMAYIWKTQPARIEAPLQILLSKPAIKKIKSVLGLKSENMEKVPMFRREIIKRSPVFYADRINAPMIMFYGGQDPVSFPEDGRRIVESLRSRGFDAEITVFDDQSHGYSMELTNLAFGKVFEFLDSRVPAR